MYQSAFTYRPRIVRFCQWSRKAYAAFASLKIQVTMGMCQQRNHGGSVKQKRIYSRETVFPAGKHRLHATGRSLTGFRNGNAPASCRPLPSGTGNSYSCGRSLSRISGIYSSLLFCFTVRDIHPSRIDFLFIRRNTNLIS